VADAPAPPVVVRLQRRFAAPPERVFSAWLDPALVGRWMSPVGHAEAEFEPWVGGRLRVTMVGDGARIEHTGQFREVDPPRRLVFTWESPYTGSEPSLVTVELRPAGSGTDLLLVHERLPEHVVAAHAGGWGTMLDRLAALIGGT
jgi:uncharacterized protein YndB with AHSA1/START domain